MRSELSRRAALVALAAGATGTLGATASGRRLLGDEEPVAPLKGNIRHSVSRWCFGRIPMEEFCVACKRIGIESIELLPPSEWPVVKRHGLTCAMTSAGLGIADGFNRRENHDRLVEELERIVPLAAEAGMPSIICMSGNRRGMDDEEGMDHCVVGLKRIVGLCEKHKVNLVMELLNSRVDHADYMCDRTAWGVALCEKVASPRFKLLYDIYHMQIMEGDLIRTIRAHHDWIAHYHTGGNPGRNEIDETQEIYYPAVMRAIVETGYQGFVGQEFVPSWDDPLAALEKCVRICDV
jgi:hydroxypyruvate isomerase